MNDNCSTGLLASTGFWAIVGALLGAMLGYVGLLLHDWQRRRENRKALGSLLHGELVTMTPGDAPAEGDPAIARLLVFVTLPQLLTSGVLNPKDDTALLMLLLRLQAAVSDFNDRARTYNDAVATDRHPQVIAQMRRDLDGPFRDYKDAHEQLIHQIEVVGELGGPLDLQPMLELAPWEELRAWWRGEVRFWQHSESRSQWLRGCAGRVRQYIARGLPVRRRLRPADAQEDPRERDPDIPLS